MKRIKFLFYIIFSSLIIFLNQSLQSQTSFVANYSTLSDEVPFHAIETDDGMYIISAKIGDYTVHNYKTLFIKLNQYGDTVKTLTVTKSPDYCIGSDLIKSKDGNFFCTGMVSSSQEAVLWLLKLSPDLEILMDTTYQIGLTLIQSVYSFMNHRDELILYGYGQKENSSNTFIYKLSQTGDSIKYQYLNDDGNEYVFSMIEKNDSLGYYFAIYGKYQINTDSWGQILTIDSNLNVSRIDPIPMHLILYYNTKLLNKSEYYLTGKTYDINKKNNQQLLCILQMDTTFQVKDSLYLGRYDTINYPAYLHNLSFVDTNTIFYGGTCNQSSGGDFSSSKSFFLLGCLTTTLDKKWEKYIGGDMYYTLWSVVATSDMGCLLLGCTYDYLTQNMERDILIIKVDSTGIMTSTNGHDIQLCDAIVYPNPGIDYIYIRSGTQIKGARMVIYDLDGSQVSTALIENSIQQVDVRSFLPGIYVWQIILNNKVILTGKWIKA